VLGVTSWWYPPGILLGILSLALLSVPWRRAFSPRLTLPLINELTDNLVELTPTDYSWLFAVFFFVAFALFFVTLTGLRFILFPPLVVIGFEMFGHPAICPWARRPLLLPVSCFLTAAGGLLFWRVFGVGAAAAACSMAWGAIVLRLLDLHVPPAIAVALLPLVMESPTIAYPLSVAIGTLLLTLWFLLYQSSQRRRSQQEERSDDKRQGRAGRWIGKGAYKKPERRVRPYRESGAFASSGHRD
jgi:HPP family